MKAAAVVVACALLPGIGCGQEDPKGVSVQLTIGAGCSADLEILCQGLLWLEVVIGDDEPTVRCASVSSGLAVNNLGSVLAGLELPALPVNEPVTLSLGVYVGESLLCSASPPSGIALIYGTTGTVDFSKAEQVALPMTCPSLASPCHEACDTEADACVARTRYPSCSEFLADCKGDRCPAGAVTCDGICTAAGGACSMDNGTPSVFPESFDYCETNDCFNDPDCPSACEEISSLLISWANELAPCKSSRGACIEDCSSTPSCESCGPMAFSCTAMTDYEGCGQVVEQCQTEDECEGTPYCDELCTEVGNSCSESMAVPEADSQHLQGMCNQLCNESAECESLCASWVARLSTWNQQLDECRNEHAGCLQACEISGEPVSSGCLMKM